MEQTVLKDFQKEIEKMNEDDARLKTIKELDTIKKERRYSTIFGVKKNNEQY